MYPLNIFSLFPPFPRENKVFVAMDFDSQFDKRWTDVIVPGVSKVEFNGVKLEPYRVDIRRVSDSILTEIITGISNCRLFFADLTTIGRLNKKPIRNGNVMYEVGLAHAVRLPEEVILFRSDNDSLMFDLANIRVNYYDPDTEPKISRQHVSDALTTAFKEIDLQKHLAVRRGSESLNFHEWSILIKSLSNDRVINPPLIRTMRDAASKTFDSNAITRLLELGIIKTNYTKVTSEIIKQEADTPIDDWKMMSYKVTSYGIEVIKDSATRMDVFTPKIIKVIESLASEENLQE